MIPYFIYYTITWSLYIIKTYFSLYTIIYNTLKGVYKTYTPFLTFKKIILYNINNA